MVNQFMCKVIPEGDADRVRRIAAESATIADLLSGCCADVPSKACSDLDCADCIFNYKHKTEMSALLKFIHAELGKKEEDMCKDSTDCNSFPKLETGDLVLYESKAGEKYLMLVLPNGGHAYSLRSGAVVLESVAYDLRHIDTAALKVYRTITDNPISSLTISNILAGADVPLYFAKCVWSKPEFVELTVDEISEKLGYKVKVVGNKED